MIMKEELVIVAQEEIAPRIFAMDLSGEMVAEMAAGQFLHIRVPDASKVLRRPISISQVDKEAGVCRIIYRIEGEGTRLFSQMPVGQLLDCMGPQGNGFDTSFLTAGQSVLLIGGGIGVPPLVELAKEIVAKGCQVTAVIGFAHQAAVILEEELAKYGRVIVTTDDGSYGRKGYVSEMVDAFPEDFDAVYSCGAPGMLRYVDSKFAQHVHAYMSLESRMACGMGACYACVVHPKEGQEADAKRGCEEGPVFPTGSLVL
ncbi:dihydroorotate dehydrogenase electron transfer subunit [Streptococcus gallolyticus]|nr:dihydroorotate dehydrogenase electron transfer subunit [Streptococcus gallolyticus]MBY5041909.1 dihydroorotate dehydrogenase electron transfer subunit [Streptococcus gallolyticus]